MTRRLFSVAALAILTSSLACSGSGRSGTAASPPPGASAASGTSAASGSGTAVAGAPVATGRWYAGDLHVHSRHSADTKHYGDDVATTIRLAESSGLDFISITDHRQTTVLSDPQLHSTPTSLIVMAGEEWGGSGHAGAHNLVREPLAHSQDFSAGVTGVPARIQAVIDDVHAQGGFFILNHPMDAKSPWFWDVSDFDGVEVWNQSWAYRRIIDTTDADVRQEVLGLGMTAAGMDAPPEAYRAIANRGGGKNYQNLKFYEELITSGHHIAAVGGGDRHFLMRPGYPTTVVFAEDPTPAGITAGVRRGRTYVTRGPDGPRVDFRADRDGDGRFESLLGDVLPLATIGAIDFRIAVEDAAGGKVELVRNGQVIQTWQIPGGSFVASYTDQPTTRAWYRVNVYEPIDLSIPDGRWIKMLVTGVPLGNLGFLGSTIQSLLNRFQTIVNLGGPMGIYLLFFGHRAGLTQSPIHTALPTIIIPEGFSRIMNIDLQDPDYCRGAITSAIYVE